MWETMSGRVISLTPLALRARNCVMTTIAAKSRCCLRAPEISVHAVPVADNGRKRSSFFESRRGFAARAKSKGAASAKPAEEGLSKKQLALSMALKQVEISHGKGAVMQLGSAQAVKVEVISTGSLSLDHALGVGGLPKGRVVEVYGPESSGKTTVALHAVAQCQKMGGTAVFIDAEHALDSAYASAVGVDMSKLYLAQPDNGEQALDIVDTLVRSSAVDMVVVDSVAALVPKAELAGEMGDHHIALQARLMSQALRKLTAILSNTSCTLVFINQIRQKVGVVFGSADVTTGGMALRFYASVRLEVRKGQQIKSNGEIVGTKVKVKVAKNKLAPPFGKAEVDLMYGKGFDLQGELLDLGCDVGLLSKSGAWFAVNSSLGVGSTELEEQAAPWLIGQGREKSKAFLLSNPRLSAKLQVAVAGKLASGGTPAAASNTTSEEIISDPPSIAASSETVEANESTTVDSVLGGAPEGEPSVSTRDVGLSPHEGVPVDAEEGEDILLEPGVASVEELLKSDVFSKEGGRGMEQRQGDPTATVQG
ncbi:unnamed protein product [Ascophyllum nodosum]